MKPKRKPVQGQVVKWNKEQTAHLRERLKSTRKPRRKKSQAEKLADAIFEPFASSDKSRREWAHGVYSFSLWLHRNDLLAAIRKFYPEDADVG